MIGLAISGIAAPHADAATSVILFGHIQYDSPGKDTRTNASLNAEYVTIWNHSHHTVSLTGWRVWDAAGHRYVFGHFALHARSYVRIHTGHGRNGVANVYWNSGNYIWNNNRDTAVLRNQIRRLADVCKWTHDAPGYINC